MSLDMSCISSVQRLNLHSSGLLEFVNTLVSFILYCMQCHPVLSLFQDLNDVFSLLLFSSSSLAITY